MSPTIVLSPASRQCLVQAGWYETRTIDTGPFEKANRKSGLFVGTLAINFFREFGGLKLTYPHFRVPGELDWSHFDESWAQELGITKVIGRYECAIGSRLTVLGAACSDHMILCMDEKGRVFGGFEDSLVKFGDSGIDAINCLCEGREGSPVAVSSPPLPNADAKIQLSNAAILALRKSGWTDDRLVRTAPNVGESLAADFFREFEGVNFQYAIAGTMKKDRCIIERRIDFPSASLQKLRATIEQDVVPVGQLLASGLILLMAHDGRVFGCMREASEPFYLIGLSGKDAINKLVAGQMMLRVR